VANTSVCSRRFAHQRVSVDGIDTTRTGFWPCSAQLAATSCAKPTSEPVAIRIRLWLCLRCLTTHRHRGQRRQVAAQNGFGESRFWRAEYQRSGAVVRSSVGFQANGRFYGQSGRRQVLQLGVCAQAGQLFKRAGAWGRLHPGPMESWVTRRWRRWLSSVRPCAQGVADSIHEDQEVAP